MKTARIQIRLPQSVKNKLELAASMQSCGVAQFVTDAAVEKAKAILHAEQQILKNKELLSKIT